MTIAKAELDSHADTCCLGETCLVIHDTEQLVSVEPFDKKLGSQQVKIVTAAVAYVCPAIILILIEIVGYSGSHPGSL